MKLLTFPRSLLFACFLLPACGDDKGDDTGSTTAATPATPAADPTVDSMDPTVDSMGTVDPSTDSTDPSTDPTADPTGDPSTDPSSTPTDPSTDPTADPTGDDGTFCQEECAADGDCTLGGTDIGFKCVDGRCAGGCADDNACIQMFSGWVTDCVDQAGCPGQACIDIGGGVGKCATVPSDFLMCDAIMQDEVMLPPIEGGAEIAVCANTDFTCTDGQCVNPCDADADCMPSSRARRTCDTGTGHCALPRRRRVHGRLQRPDTPTCTDRRLLRLRRRQQLHRRRQRPDLHRQRLLRLRRPTPTAPPPGPATPASTAPAAAAPPAACTGTKAFDGTAFVCEGF
jgi:hypothetical protein